MRNSILGIVLLSLIACDLPPAFPTPPTTTAPPPPGSWPTITSVSPPSVAAGSGEIRITIKGSGFLHPTHQPAHNLSFVMWNGQLLETKAVSTSQLRATVPASLLKNSGTAKLWVINRDVMSDRHLSTSPPPYAITFTITE